MKICEFVLTPINHVICMVNRKFYYNLNPRWNANAVQDSNFSRAPTQARAIKRMAWTAFTEGTLRRATERGAKNAAAARVQIP